MNQRLTSDAVHNRNCYEYFLQLKPSISDEIKGILPCLNELPLEEYQATYPYGNLYSRFMSDLEKYIENNPLDQTPALDNLIVAIYVNDNQILENASWINQIGAEVSPIEPNISKKIAQHLEDSRERINQRPPSHQKSAHSRTQSFFSESFKPQHGTNLPSKKNYVYKKDSDPDEYRFSTQAQRHKGKIRISPLFIRWLRINAQRNPNKGICHVYFNNLPLDRNTFDIEGFKEKGFSEALHSLEDDSTLHIAVITLPAYRGLMESSDYKRTQDKLPYGLVFDELLDVAIKQKHRRGIADFRISNHTRGLLFESHEKEKEELEKLLRQSFTSMGIFADSFLSTAQKQAVWVHFIKYELTNYILEQLQPKSFNFSCKNAIDRGALSSTYYNLIKSFASDHPMQRDKFEQSVDAPAAYVEARGMNFHREILWNALGTYVNAHFKELRENPQKSWLIYWCDKNCPYARAKTLLDLRIKQFISSNCNSNNHVEEWTYLINTIKTFSEKNTIDPKLLLAVLSLTSEVINTPSPDLINQYTKLSQDIKIKHPVLSILGGIMETLLGVILFIPSLGYSQKLIQQGYCTAKTGFFAADRETLIDKMKNFTPSIPQTSSS